MGNQSHCLVGIAVERQLDQADDLLVVHAAGLGERVRMDIALRHSEQERLLERGVVHLARA